MSQSTLFWMTSGMTAVLVALGVLELALHRRRLARLRLRIHVNGSRGKSSVTRLIAAGLREGGVRTCAKTTGTLPRVILPDGQELPVFRAARPNVIEQIRIVEAACGVKSECLVIECMALQPALQWLSEDKLVHATHAVITNIRPDHLDIMGPTERDVALALAGMIPPHGVLYTGERRHIEPLRAACADRAARCVVLDEAELQAVTSEELAEFSYAEHAENVALALRVCTDLGVPRDAALAGMQAAKADPGALTEHLVEFFTRRILFVNGFAANDPISTERVWEETLARHTEWKRRVAVFNCRSDRPDRSLQLAREMVRWSQPDFVILMGTGTHLFARAALAAGFSSRCIDSAEGLSTPDIFERIVERVQGAALVMGMGNIGGQGLELVRYFRNRSVISAQDAS